MYGLGAQLVQAHHSNCPLSAWCCPFRCCCWGASAVLTAAAAGGAGVRGVLLLLMLMRVLAWRVLVCRRGVRACLQC